MGFATAVAVVGSSLVVTAASAAADVAPTAGQVETVTADSLPTVQIDGVVWAQAVVGATVFAGGEFATARPAGSAPGVDTTPRANLVAYNLQTGVMTDWNPGANGVIKSITASPDGSRFYVSGGFTEIAGQPRYRVAAFDSSGALLPWAPYSNAQVNAVAQQGDTVWLTGNFTSIAGGTRTRLAAVSASTAALLPLSADIAGGFGTTAIVVDPTGSKVVIAGSFLSVNGSTNPGRGMAALDATTGALVPWAANALIRNAGAKAAMTDLASDGDSVYGSGYSFTGATAEDGFEGTFRARWSDGSLVWLEDCHGDDYSVAVSTDAVYTASHNHYCGNIGGFPETDPRTYHHSMAFAKAYQGKTLTADPFYYKSYTGQPAASYLHWFPNWQVGTYTGKGQATWDVETSGDYVLYGGEFLAVNGKDQQGLARFAKKNSVQPQSGPERSGDAFTVAASSLRAGEVRLLWQSNSDRDDEALTYQVFREDKGTTTPIYTTTSRSTFWNQPLLAYIDTTAAPGATYRYRVRAVDSSGNRVTGAWSSVTVAAANQASEYRLSVVDDGAVHYWPLAEADGAVGTDLIGRQNLTVNGATRGTSGPDLLAGGTATQFAGKQTSYASSIGTYEQGKHTLSVEAWVKTTSTTGGKIVGFGNKGTGNSTLYDRQLYLDASGRVSFGVYPLATRTVSTGTGYNDGKWHHIVGTLDTNGMSLYVDGARLGYRADTTSARPLMGYWRVGGDAQTGWPNNPVSGYLNAAVADVAIYDTALTRTQINDHWVGSGRSSTVPAAPADAYGKAVYNLSPTLYWRLGDAASSSAADAGLDNQPGTYFGAVTKGSSGALVGSADTAATFAPVKTRNVWTQTGVSSDKTYTNPTSFAIETWFKTTTTTGGKLVGFGAARTGQSASNDRHIYMSNDGTINFGVYPGAQSIISSKPGFNDGRWHHVVGQISSSGMQLYLDGALVANGTNTVSQVYTGYWRVGGDTGWAGDIYWRGSLDEVAIYGAPLTPASVLGHYQLGTLGYANEPPRALFGAVTNAANQDVTFDASASVDPNGPIASYTWAFGDGQTGTGKTATHTYATPGTYVATLTVTDQLGASSSTTDSVIVKAANRAPVAAFNSTVRELSFHGDASSSSDPDGTIVSYAWNFGDGATAQTAVADHVYPAPGEYTVTVTVTDDRGGSAIQSKTITIVQSPNVAPTAAFASTTDGLTAALDAAASADSDGTIAAYAWDFGDGSSAAGVKTSHAFTAPGTYIVTLTVTDNRGGTAVKAAQVTVAVTDLIARDLFERSGTNGWGTGDKGGAWTTTGTAARFSVDAGAGRIVVNPGSTLEADLLAVSSTATRVTADFSVDKVAPGQYINIVGRQVGASQYVLRMRVEADGGVRLYLLRDSTAVGSSVLLTGLTLTAGTSYTASFEVNGTSPTTLSAKLWRSSDAAPSAWQVTRADTSANGAALQAAGSVGVSSWLPSSAASFAPVTVSFGSLVVTDPSIAAANRAPVAAFAASAADLTANVDASASSDADGTISGYAWDFGDGQTGAGRLASHVYGASGIYDITLTVTDDDGASTSSSQRVTVTRPNQAPTAAFVTSTSSLVTTADAATSSDSDGRIVSYAWSFGDGTTATGAQTSHTYAAAGSYSLTLTVTDDGGATHSSTQTVTAVSPPVNSVLFTDSFERAAAGAWGTADTGTAWSLTGTTSRFSIADGAGRIAIAPGAVHEADQTSVSTTSARVTAEFSLDKIAEGQYIGIVGRQVGTSQYILRLRVEAGGGVKLNLLRDGTAVGSAVVVQGLTLTAGEKYTVAFEVTGTSPTTLSGKVWRSADAQPTSWQVTRSDTAAAAAALQAAGSIGVFTWLPSSAGAASPVTVSFSHISVIDPSKR